MKVIDPPYLALDAVALLLHTTTTTNGTAGASRRRCRTI